MRKITPAFKVRCAWTRDPFRKACQRLDKDYWTAKLQQNLFNSRIVLRTGLLTEVPPCWVGSLEEVPNLSRKLSRSFKSEASFYYIAIRHLTLLQTSSSASATPFKGSTWEDWAFAERNLLDKDHAHVCVSLLSWKHLYSVTLSQKGPLTTFWPSNK